jgi:hypothetical protein
MNSNGYISFNSKNIEFDKTYPNFNLNTRNIKAWGVVKSGFTNRTPNVTPYNNKLAVSDGTFSYVVDIEPGFYDINDFASALQTKLITDSFPGWVVTVEVDLSLTVSNVIPFNFVEINEVNKDLATMAGWPIKTINDPLNTSLNGRPILIYSNYVDFTSSDINQTNKSDDYSSNNSTRNILERIFITNGTTATINNNQNETIKYMSVNGELFVGNLKIVLKDEYGNDYYDPDNLNEYNLLLLTK